jgi:DMSO/TMAO reductase YedYZ molybdopterin-dependent catalytic subunit
MSRVLNTLYIVFYASLFSGVSTARWTGVPLNVVLNVYGGGLNRKANYVCFEGCDNTSKVI